jgi:hypothetical protein
MVTNNSCDIPTGASGTVLQGQGIGSGFAFSTATYPAIATGTGTLLRADGTNWVATTSTYPNTNAVSTLLYASSSNVMGALATANNGLLVTSNTGVPSILAGPGTTGNILQSNAAAAPSFSTATYPATATGTGTILRADGTNWAATTATYPATTTSQQILYSTAANVVGQLTTANSAIAATNSSGTLAMRAFSVVIQTFTSTGTYTPTAGMLYCLIQSLGGGGAGGGGPAATGQYSTGGGGGAGEYAVGVFSASTIGASQSVTIGAAGTGNSGTTGGNGGNTSVGALISANGGSGGPTGAAGASSSCLGGAGGTGGSGGSYRCNGAYGIAAFAIVASGLNQGGYGGNSQLGAGAPYTFNANGAAATGNGAGGGGCGDGGGGTARTGGNGTKGIVVVTEYVIA